MTITIGIDPHKGSHTAVAIDSNEHVLDEIRLRSCSTQTVRLHEWAHCFEERTWAVESAHGLGYLLAQQLVAAGENVIDVPPVRASRVRVLGSGKSQKNDRTTHVRSRSLRYAPTIWRPFVPMIMRGC
jgi:transposase